ncbi:MAG: Na+/H+ antiporter [Gammaproteobacteria bacterium]|nr:Na+/H+ antiporter [Gammaproteobacteria bacterium]
MNFIEAAIFILFLAIISVPIATRFRLPLEIFLLFGSALISLMPGLSNFKINPIIILNLFLPPILFYAAYFTSWQDFKFNIRPISLLAFGLVIFTMVVIACISKIALPQFSWGESFLLGAIISPTDAASATTIIKKFGAPRRLVIILEGESLINDATALILFRFSLAAVIGGSFSVTSAITQFLYITTGGIILGLVLGFLAVSILQKINSVSAETTLTFVTAFTCYILGEHLGVSGVITTVVTGIYLGLRFPEVASSQTRINAKASWNTLMFIINGFVFALIGLELPTIIQNLQTNTWSNLIYYGLLISCTVIAARIIWVFSAAYLSRLLVPIINRNDPLPTWRGLFVLSWTGMRGIVSLATALAIPYFISTAVPFPHRDLILFITYCVIVFTLIIPTVSLPLMLRIFKLSDPENKMKQEAIARMQSLKGAVEHLHAMVKKEKIPEPIFEEFLNQIERRLKVIETQLSERPYSTLNNEYLGLKRLTLAAIESERKTLLKLRKSGDIHDEIFHQLSDELDLEEMRAKTLRI